MTTEQVERLLKQGEGISVEFKKARNAIPNDATESVCAFLNRQGGYLLLGVRNDGHIIGVDEDAADAMQRDFVSLTNNSNKLQPVCLLELKSIRIRGILILYAYIPQSSEVHNSCGIIFDRGHEGDFRVLSNTAISQLYTRKSSYYSESKIFPYLGASAFKPGILDRVRTLIKNNTPNHPWLGLEDKEFLRKAGLYKNDFATGETGYTLAAALLLGRDEVIHDILPHFRIDALVRRQDMDRYDDRLDIRTNLVDAYDLLMDFVAKHLPDAFHMHGHQRVSLREKIFREIVANVLVHREYTNATPARFIIYSDYVEVDNANKPKSYGPINPERFSPFPKNPSISRFFTHIGRVDELGSGVVNVTNFLKSYVPGGKALFIEEDVFRTTVPVPSIVRAEVILPSFPVAASLDTLIDKLSALELGFSTSDRLAKEIGYFYAGEVLVASEVAEMLGVTERTVRRDFQILRDAGIIEAGRGHATYQLANKIT